MNILKEKLTNNTEINPRRGEVYRIEIIDALPKVTNKKGMMMATASSGRF